MCCVGSAIYLALQIAFLKHIINNHYAKAIPPSLAHILRASGRLPGMAQAQSSPFHIDAAPAHEVALPCWRAVRVSGGDQRLLPKPTEQPADGTRRFLPGSAWCWLMGSRWPQPASAAQMPPPRMRRHMVRCRPARRLLPDGAIQAALAISIARATPYAANPPAWPCDHRLGRRCGST